MKFFLDSAKIDEIRYARDMWAIDGVTSNPRHIKASGKPFLSAVEDLAALGREFGDDFAISVEVNPHHTTAEAMVEEGERIWNMCPSNFVVKLPCIDAGYKALQIFGEKDIPCNMTLCFNAVQALQAGRLGARFISRRRQAFTASGLAFPALAQIYFLACKEPGDPRDESTCKCL